MDRYYPVIIYILQPNIGEKVGGSSKTETGDDFNKLQQETEIRREATEKLHEAMQEYLKTYSKRKESAIAPKDKKLSVEILGLAMSNFGNLLDVDSSYGIYDLLYTFFLISVMHFIIVWPSFFEYFFDLGKCLIEYSEFTKDMASRQNEFVAKVREGYSASLSHDIIEIKDYIVICFLQYLFIYLFFVHRRLKRSWKVEDLISMPN